MKKSEVENSDDKRKKIIKIFKILNIYAKLDCEIDQNMTIENN